MAIPCPRAFKKNIGFEVGLYYYFNLKAWLTQSVFFERILSFKRNISARPGRNCVLLLDNVLVQGGFYTLPELPHMKVMFLPSNKTSQIQAVDGVIIASVKEV